MSPVYAAIYAEIYTSLTDICRYENNKSFFRLISRYFKFSQLYFLKYLKYYLRDILGFLRGNLGSG